LGASNDKLRNALLLVGAGSILITLAAVIYQDGGNWPTSVRETVLLSVAFAAALGFTALIE
jgi:hypothetical protein